MYIISTRIKEILFTGLLKDMSGDDSISQPHALDWQLMQRSGLWLQV